ncbi:MAG: peptide chain release factor N(5)-glutamine methyltransferase [Bdellovibrionaceae bacterium]|nr:peptide chain release factor N(5)-glutamine methyltransferase [Pseudobdellovibrionaceae bacterium]
MTIKEVMDKTTTFFKQKGFLSPRLDAELLIAHGLGCERLQLYLKFDQPLKEHEVTLLRDLVKRRTTGEPVAYILGKKDFYKNSFLVNQSVLIPRPETETLVEMAANFIESQKPYKQFKILDIGGGSGCIGISLAKEFPDAHVTIIEKSNEASAVIAENARLNKATNVSLVRVDASDIELFKQCWNPQDTVFKASQSDVKSNSTANGCDGLGVNSDTSEVLASVSADLVFDIVVSNPPYIAKDDKDVEENVKKYEPQEALFADEDGYLFLKDWTQKYAQLLRGGGKMIFEMGHTQGNRLSEYLQKLNIFTSVNVVKDLSGKDRFIVMVK